MKRETLDFTIDYNPKISPTESPTIHAIIEHNNQVSLVHSTLVHCFYWDPNRWKYGFMVFFVSKLPTRYHVTIIHYQK